MTVLSSGEPLKFLGETSSEVFDLTLGVYPVTIYRGTPMIIDQSVDATAITTMDGVTAVDGDVFVGIAAHDVIVPEVQTVAPKVEVYTWPTIVGFKSTVAADDDMGKPIYKSDSGTLTLSNGAYPSIGKVFRVRDGYVYVLLDPPTVLDVP